MSTVATAQQLSPTMGPRREVVQPIRTGASVASPTGSDDWNASVASIARAADPEIMTAIAGWRALQQSDRLDFSAYASFLITHPGWPGEDRMRRLAEAAISPDSFAPVEVITFFERFPPRTANGLARHAIALSALGRTAAAQEQARAAWRAGTLAPADEARLSGLFGSGLSQADHSARADMLLWQHSSDAATRMLGFLPPDARQVAEARIAMQRGLSDAGARMQFAEPYAQGDPGFLFDKAEWLKDNGNAIAARRMLAERTSLTRRPARVEKWFELLLSSARAAASDGDFRTAYDIASKVDDAYDPDVSVRSRPYGERDDYTSLVWLAGMTALEDLQRPRDAVGMFDRYATAARSEQTISRGYYWAGRAALEAGDSGMAERYFASAADYPGQFHGQLALERLHRVVPAPAQFAIALPAPGDEEKRAFAQRSLVRAARALGVSGLWTEQSQFLRAIAEGVVSDNDRALALDLAKSLNRLDLGVMVGRKALADGRSGYSDDGFPRVAVPAPILSQWTMIHAISRQESQFDRAARSRAGARGLMQLMPATAEETARKVGLAYLPGSLTEDPQYNIQLGSAYFERMLSYYGGSYPLAVAAYNAGPGNVNRWLAKFGDPRLPGADIIEWIENIPLSETRNYVQRVLENAVVYDAIQPEYGRFRDSLMPLSKYLGKNQPG